MDVMHRPQRDQRGRFLTGNSGGGRPRGARNRLSEDFLAALADDFAEHGADAIAKCRLTNPSVYVRVVASLIPKDAPEAPEAAYSHMSLPELREYVIGQILEEAEIAAALQAQLVSD